MVLRKIADRAVEIVGMCLLLDDQAATPVRVRMRHSAEHDAIDWMDCRIGIPGSVRGGILRLESTASNYGRISAEVAEDPDGVAWVFGVEFGDRPHA